MSTEQATDWVPLCEADELAEGESRVREDGVAVFRHRGRLYAVEDRCAHGRGSLAAGDIEDIEPSAVACGRLPAKSACVRCPRHRSKFAGGLWYSLETGASLTLGPTPHHAPAYRVGKYGVKEENGKVFVTSRALATSPALTLHDKFQIRVQKVAKALTCGCVAPTPAKEFAPLTGHVWDVTSVASVSHDCVLVHLACAAGVLSVGDITDAHLWHVSLRLDVDNELVERDYTPVSSLEEYCQGILKLWIRVYADGRFTSALSRKLKLGCTNGHAPIMRLEVSTPKSTLLLKPPRGGSLLLVSGGTGLAPVLQAFKVAVHWAGGTGGGSQAASGGRGDPSASGCAGLQSVVLVHSARTVADVCAHMLDEMACVVAAAGGAGVAARVHVAITGEGELGRLKTPFAVSLTPGRITLGGAEGTLAQAWQGRSGVCVVSGPQGMLDDVKRLAVDHLSIPVDLCHLLEA